jgi:GAF domain-containing protein
MDYARGIPIKPERGTASGRALLEGRVIHIPDVKADPEYTWLEAQRLGDFRTVLCMPMLREGVPIGILVLARSEVRPFTDKQIELVTTFADQAAIAIENMRLLEAERERTRELAKSLEDLRNTQTASFRLVPRLLGLPNKRPAPVLGRVRHSYSDNGDDATMRLTRRFTSSAASHGCILYNQ